MSSVYYAMFHCLAECCANSLIGTSPSDRSNTAWLQTYRALKHGAAKEACKSQKETLKKFPKDVRDFALGFWQLQEKRVNADYNPTEHVHKTDVVQQIAIADDLIQRFKKVKAPHKRAFTAFVLFKPLPK